MLAVVVDNNVVVSSIFWGGASHRVMAPITSGKVKGFTSQNILSELITVLAQFRYRLPEAKCSEIIDVYEKAFETLEVRKVEADIEDADDLKFLACISRAKADYLITGDSHLLKLGAFGGTRIIRPAAFLSLAITPKNKPLKRSSPKKSNVARRSFGLLPRMKSGQQIKNELRKELYD